MSIPSEPPAALRPQTGPHATPRAVGALILREITTTYGRSPGGYIWAILEPAAGITLLTLVFSIGFRTPPLGTSFALFYAAGVLPLMMYTDISTKLAQTIQFSRALLTYPRITFLDALIARFILNFLTQMMVHFIVLGFILVFLKPMTTIDYSKISQAYLLTLALAIGIGTLNSFLTLAYPVWQTAWSILNRPLFLLSCVFFIFESVPQPYSDYLWFNPIVHIAGLMRDGFYPFYQPSYVSVVYPLAVAALTTMAGLFLLNRYHRDILDK
ncbi:ABC transporter permease [Sulfitobacter sp. M57]|uniref:ABC transporter permease n=1 Tax=unclassified Sulfitobacter TaxID=196795 RepID=UPI0023E0CB97|nr:MULTISPECIES: ABC transporter permease [unclassified Sulfitobacter]MDF3415045.1 ABC transporter permease [Sulfitobacter sp. KE5]MDF3422526.1 ABC transporter permease [Sulfitobacter sp. KE43]MDF3433591.1 ABC transporter permease [Sulfitobacter sp. KE42]MDF3459231.1 ABC transporter permease [Sulfitobacter sp. S74]MDF3463130.1 ABC transporter permease [Sulfitobacter sp. Ks18]